MPIYNGEKYMRQSEWEKLSYADREMAMLIAALSFPIRRGLLMVLPAGLYLTSAVELL